MASYGKKMLEAALNGKVEKNEAKTPAALLLNKLPVFADQKRQPRIQSSSSQRIPDKTQLLSPSEQIKPDKVSLWLDTCPDSVSEVQSEIIPPSVSSKEVETSFPTLQCDVDSKEDENDRDYQPSSDGEDSIEVADQTFDEADRNESQLGSDGEDSIEVADQTFDEAGRNESQLVNRAITRNGAVILNKQQFFYYCEKPQLKLARHLTSQHNKELAVAEILAAKSASPKKYQAGLKRIKCLGNFVHNVRTLEKQKSDIVVVKRPTKPREVSHYLPCIHCYGFYVVDELWKHTKNCDLKLHDKSLCSNVFDEAKKLLTSSSAVQQARLLLDSSCLQKQSALSDEMRSLVLSMHQDELCEQVKKDLLLNQFGETLRMKYGPRRKNDIGQRLRQLARLLVKCRERMSDTSLQYMDLLCGKHFDTCLSGTFALCELNITDDGRREFKIPSLALRLGHLLKKLTTIKQGYCLRNDYMEGLKQAENFGQLLQSEWTDAIASNAHNTLKRRKDQAVQVLPLTEDLWQLRHYQIKEMINCIGQIKETPSYSTWRTLAQLTMTRMIIFNKRRGGEVSKLLLQTYKTRPDWKNTTNEEVMSSLQPLEQKLLDRVDLVQIPGKKNRKVPMLITIDVKEAIEALNAHRDIVGIPSSNPFCFASRSTGHLDSWQAMSSISQKACLERPELVTSTKLRKYNATVSQLFDLNHGELEWLSNHMGHDLNIHKDFYRLHDSTIEIAKVSRLLMAIDSGNAAQFVGKKLTDISLEDFGSRDIESKEIETDPVESSLTVAVESELEANDNDHLQNSAQETDLPTSDTLENKVVERHASVTKASTFNTRKRKITKTVSDSEDEDSMPNQNKTVKLSQKSTWTSKEVQVLKKSFGHILEQGTYPSGKQIQVAIRENACLQNRTVLNIRSKLQHLMKKKH